MRKFIVFFYILFIGLSTRAQSGPKLVGMTFLGGSNNIGSIFQYTGGDTTLGSISSFSVNGNATYNTFTAAPNGKFYGLVDGGSGGSYGSIMQYDYPSNMSLDLFNFRDFNLTDTMGDYPAGSLLLANDGILYGLTSAGGWNSNGTLFSYTLGDTTVTLLADLNTYANPFGSLIQAFNGNLYGMTMMDGANSSGTIFQYNIASHIYSPIYSLPVSAKPYGSLLEVGQDTLYGMTQWDGIFGGGTIFRFAINTGVYEVLYNLPQNANPSGSLIRATDGYLYGMTQFDGSYRGGTIFKFNVNTGAYDTIHNFGEIPEDGLNPRGDVYQASDGMLYGVTNVGGVNSLGAIFQYDIMSAIYAKELDMQASTGSNPDGNLTEYKRAIQPYSISVCPGNLASFTASDTAVSYTVQWQVSTNGGTSFSNLPGTTNTTYRFTAFTSQNGYQYRAVFIRAGGADTSRAVSLTITHINDTATAVGDVTCIASQAGALYQWQDCDSFQNINNATSQSYTPTLRGYYRCIINMGGCVDTTNCVYVNVEGITYVSLYHFNLYPNPVSGSFTIENNYPGTLSVNIINLLGERLKAYTMTRAQQTFDISDLAAGIYEVQISDGQQTLKIMKVVKE